MGKPSKIDFPTKIQNKFEATTKPKLPFYEYLVDPKSNYE